MSELDYDLWDEPMPLEYEVARVETRRITVIRIRQPDKTFRWKVNLGDRTVLTKHGKWVHEGLSSGLTDAHLESTRFRSLGRAWTHATAAAKIWVEEMKERYRIMLEQQFS